MNITVQIDNRHNSIEDWVITLIDSADTLKELRRKELYWMYRLKAYAPYGLNEKDVYEALGPLHVTESSILGAMRVLHVFRHFITIIIMIVIIVVVVTIVINMIFITFIIIRLLGFLVKNSLLFL